MANGLQGGGAAEPRGSLLSPPAPSASLRFSGGSCGCAEALVCVHVAVVPAAGVTLS